MLLSILLFIRKAFTFLHFVSSASVVGECKEWRRTTLEIQTERKYKLEINFNFVYIPDIFQPNIQEDRAVMPSVLGVMEVTLLKILISTRKRVTKSAILPGTTSGGMRKLTQDVITNSVEGR